jgi:hypothetical protein
MKVACETTAKASAITRIDGRSVLGTGKALRVASTAHSARPSGLDGPCVQLAD